MSDIIYRMAVPADAAALLAIYAPYVAETAVSLECAVPTLGDFRARIERTLKDYPYLVALKDGEIWGYAYAGAFHPRAAFAWSAEVSVYIRRDCRRMGLGHGLYARLETLLRERGYTNLNACIAYNEAEDRYLAHDSVRFHTREGFMPVGAFHQCANKFGRWYGILWMEKHIAPHPDHPALPRKADAPAGEAQ